MARSDIHVHVEVDNAAVFARLDAMEITMSALSDAVQALTDQIAALTVRINEDVAHLQDLLAQANANDASDAAAIAALNADAADTVARLTESTDALAAIDPVADFPVEEPPAEG